MFQPPRRHLLQQDLMSMSVLIISIAIVLRLQEKLVILWMKEIVQCLQRKQSRPTPTRFSTLPRKHNFPDLAHDTNLALPYKDTAQRKT